MTFQPQPAPPSAAELEVEPTLFVVADSHLDTQWRWTIQDSIREYLPNTLHGNFAHFRNFPNFILSFEGAFRYQLIEEYYPLEFEELKRWVAAGRWHPAGAMLDAPDVNIPAPESLIRHILLGNRYFEQTFGVRSQDIFLPDGFGFGAALPTIAAHCGLKGFSSQKFIKWMAPARIPFDFGYWSGPDGNGVVAALNPEGYGSGIDDNLAEATRWRERIRSLDRDSGLQLGYKYYGLGDRGGAVDDESVRWLERAIAGGPIRVVSCRSDLPFELLTEEQTERLPRYTGELQLPTHGTGCLTSQSILKRWNRANERSADAAERLAVMADWLGARPYPAAKLRQAWTRFLWHQMHDDLTGTSIPAAYVFTWNDLILSLTEFQQVRNDSARAIARALDTEVRGEPIVVFNSLSWPRHGTVAIELAADEAESDWQVETYDGLPLSTQRNAGTTLQFEADLPAHGAVVYCLVERSRAPDTGSANTNDFLSVSETHLENRFLRVELDAAGNIRSIFDKLAQRETLSQPVTLELFVDRSNKWPAWEIRHSDLLAPADETLGQSGAEISVVERGPESVAVEVRRKAARSVFVDRIRLNASRCQVDVDSRVDWRSRGRLLKLSVTAALDDPRATFDLGCGTIERGVSERRAYELPAQQWTDLTGADSDYGLAVLSNCKYGWDRPQPSTVRLSLLRSPRTYRKFRHQATQDHGEHRYGYSLLPHTGDWRDGEVVHRAAEFNQPPHAFRTERHSGPLGSQWAFLSLSSRQVVVRALKRTEDRKSYIIRLQEAAGRSVDGVEVQTAQTIERATECNGCEQPQRDLKLTEGRLQLDFEPFELRTVEFSLTPPSTKLTPASQHSVALEPDLEATSFHSQPTRGAFAANGDAIPGELLPSTVRFGEVQFELPVARPGGANAVACRGQEITLPETEGQLWVLLAAETEKTVSFQIGERAAACTVPNWREPVGQWRTTPRKRSPSRVRELPVAWIGSHLHNRQGLDEPYTFCYLFAFELGDLRNRRVLRLPVAPEVRLFASTVVDSEESTTRPTLGGLRI